MYELSFYDSKLDRVLPEIVIEVPNFIMVLIPIYRNQDCAYSGWQTSDCRRYTEPKLILISSSHISGWEK
jgi:hypothetical protein